MSESKFTGTTRGDNWTATSNDKLGASLYFSSEQATPVEPQRRDLSPIRATLIHFAVENLCLTAITAFLFATGHTTAGGWALAFLIVNICGTTVRYSGGVR